MLEGEVYPKLIERDLVAVQHEKSERDAFGHGVALAGWSDSHSMSVSPSSDKTRFAHPSLMNRVVATRASMAARFRRLGTSAAARAGTSGSTPRSRRQ